jgi:hypothetical protein
MNWLLLLHPQIRRKRYAISVRLQALHFPIAHLWLWRIETNAKWYG